MTGMPLGTTSCFKKGGAVSSNEKYKLATHYPFVIVGLAEIMT